MAIDWTSTESHILINPKCSVEDKILYQSILENTKHLSSHLWLATSGSTTTSTQTIKWVGLSKQAILVSARAVNQHLESSSKDIWIHCLPEFHVGGLGIWARSYLQGSKVIDCKTKDYKWNAVDFYQVMQTSKATLTALVPTQIHDLVHARLKAPDSLRAVVVGGSRLSETLYKQAKDLGWNLLPSYGSTECASQVATAEIGSDIPIFKILPHMEVKILGNGRLCIKSEALFTTYAMATTQGVILTDPKEEGWFTNEDVGSVVDTHLEIKGRIGKVIKIGGENVNLDRLEALLEEIQIQKGIKKDLALIAVPNERLEHVIHLAVALSCQKGVQSLIERFNTQVLPFEKIRKVHVVPTIPRSALSKILHQELLKLIPT